MKNLLSLYLLFLTISVSINIVVLPFYTKIQLSNFPEFNETNFITYVSNTLLTDIELGEPPQKLQVYLSTYTYSFEIYNNSNNVNFIYDISKSTSFINVSHSYTWGGKIMTIGKENFYFYNDLSMTKKMQIKNISILLSKSYKENSTKYDYGSIGIKPFNTESQIYNNSLIKEIYNSKSQNNFTKNYSWQLKNINNSSFDQWIIIIGEYPHEYDSKNFKEEQLKYTTTASLEEWTLNFRQIKSENTILHTNYKIPIKFSNIHFVAPKEYKTFIYENFFYDYLEQKICFEKKDDINYIVYCKKQYLDQNTIEKFPKLEFYELNLNYTFKFTGNDLFFEKDEYYYFLIEFGVNWYFGLTFLNKYPLIFNQETRLIYYYNDEFKIEETKEGTNFVLVGKIIIAIVAGIIFIIVGIIIGKYIFSTKKKKLANELDDDYDYQNKKENKLTGEENDINEG